MPAQSKQAQGPGALRLKPLVKIQSGSELLILLLWVQKDTVWATIQTATAILCWKNIQGSDQIEGSVKKACQQEVLQMIQDEDSMVIVVGNKVSSFSASGPTQNN